MRPYLLDSSVAVRILLGHSPQTANWFDRTVVTHAATMRDIATIVGFDTLDPVT